MMNENFKGGLNNVMPWNKDPVDSRCHQRCVEIDIGHGEGVVRMFGQFGSRR